MVSVARGPANAAINPLLCTQADAVQCAGANPGMYRYCQQCGRLEPVSDANKQPTSRV
jgi:hypothetical protein